MWPSAYNAPLMFLLGMDPSAGETPAPPLFMTHNELQEPKYKNTQKTIHTQISWVFPYFAAK